MELETVPKKKYMAKYDRYEPKVKDHTAIITFKRCPREYFYRIVLGRVGKDKVIVFAWGSAYHKFREVLEVKYGFGSNMPKKFDEATAKNAFVDAAQAGLDYWQKHGKDQVIGSKFEFMTGARLAQSFKVAYEHWKLEKLRGAIQVVAVEQAFNVEIGPDTYTSGRADQIVRFQGRLWGRDFKTTSKDSAFFSRSITPNDQFSRYTVAEGKLAGEPIQGQLIECLYNAKSTKTQQKGPKIELHIASRTPSELAEWTENEVMTQKLISVCREEDVWPQFEVGCPFCAFHSVCKSPNEMSKMAQLETHFVVSPWDNTQIGED